MNPNANQGQQARQIGREPGWQPLILAFCCHYCAYAAADLAGSMRRQYPDNVRVLRLPCTGRVEVNYLLAAFERGADGVIVAGCLEGGCHFQEGNLRARRRVERARTLLAEAGLEPERLEMFNLSSAEGGRFAQIVTEMAQRVKQLGPNPLKPEPHAVETAMHEMAHETENRLAAEAGAAASGCCCSHEYGSVRIDMAAPSQVDGKRNGRMTVAGSMTPPHSQGETK